MNRNILVLLCAGLALCAMAGEPQLNRSQLRNASTEMDNDAAGASSQDVAVSLQQLLNEHNLTLNDTPSGQQAPSRQAASDLKGARVALVDAYNFNWNYEDSIPIIDSTPSAHMGIGCKIVPGGGNKYYLHNLYGDYEIPVLVDTLTGIVTLQANQQLSTICTYYEGGWSGWSDGLLRQASSSSSTSSTWTLYAAPVSWLTGNGDCHDIHGQVQDDGSIVFSDDFAFLVEKQAQNTTTWGLSAIFRNLTFIKPNGKHSYKYNKTELPNIPITPGLQPHGNGGLAPRPVNPRPGATKPVKPRQMNSGRGAVIPDDNDDTGIDQDLNTTLRYSSATGYQNVTQKEEPVYMYQENDTLWVYNLFGFDNLCYIIINANGTISLPQQAISNDGLGSVKYNTAVNGTTSLGIITWGNTYLGTASMALSRYYSSNQLQYIDGDYDDYNYFATPVFSDPNVREKSVIFSAKLSNRAFVNDDIVVFMYRYNEEEGDFEGVMNPYPASRSDESYWVYLAAISYNVKTEECSEPIYFEYEVPELDTSRLHSDTAGDVNGDGRVTITDVTVLVNALLNDNYDEINREQADLNGDNAVSITDVTSLIHLLLSPSK